MILSMAIDKVLSKHVSHDLHTELSSELEGLGIEHTCNVAAVDGCMNLDILVKSSTGEDVVIELLGPEQYTCNKPDGSYKLLGQTVFRHRILQKNDLQVGHNAVY